MAKRKKETVEQIHYSAKYFMNPIEPIRIDVIGAGGNGSLMLQMLGRIHYSLINMNHPGLMVTIHDGDKVEFTNVGRQLFSVSDIGEYKSVSLVQKINRFYNCNFIAKTNYVQDLQDLNKNCNIVITCLDSYEARVKLFSKIKSDRIERYYNENTLYYWLDLGNTFDNGQVMLSTMCNIEQPRNTQSYLKNRFELFGIDERFKDDDIPSCNIAQALGKQDLFINQTLVVYSANLLWKLFTKFCIDYQGVFINMNDLNVQKYKIAK